MEGNLIEETQASFLAAPESGRQSKGKTIDNNDLLI